VEQTKFLVSRGRFSEEEKKSFGRWSFLAANPRCFGGQADAVGMARTASVPAMHMVELDENQEEEDLFLDAASYDLHQQVKGVLEKLLPTSREGHRDAFESMSASLKPGSPQARPPELQLAPSAVPTPKRASRCGSKSPARTPNRMDQVLTPARGSRTKSKSPRGCRTPHKAEQVPTPTRTRGEQMKILVHAASQKFEQEASPDGGVGGNGEALSAGAGKFQKDVLERFRQQLLQRFLSLHDAFSRMNHEVSRDKALTRKEFHVTLARLGAGEEESEDIFEAMDSHGDGGVTLSEFLHALVDVSPEALLWELRCRLLRFNIGPHNLQKALELVRWPQHGWMSRATKVKRRGIRRRCACCSSTEACRCKDVDGAAGGEAALDAALPGLAGAAGLGLLGGARPHSAPGGPCEEGGEEETRKRPTPYHLGRGDWLKFCTSLYLTLLEAERLFLRLADNKRLVDLRVMFETLRNTVEPDVTLERFVVKACSRYDKLASAFSAFSEDRSYLPNCPEPLMWWAGFRNLAIALNVNDENSAQLWRVLTTGVLEAGKDDLLADLNEYEQTGVSVTEEVFVRELSMWAPDTALETLKENLCNRFGSLAEGQRALGRRLSDTSQLSAQEFESRLRAAGIKNCDVGKALSTVASKGGHVSLEAAIDTMRAVKGGKTAAELGKSSQSAVRNQTQPCWEQLRTVQKDCQRRYDDGAEGDSWASSMTRSSSTPTRPGVEDQHKFTESIIGAVNTAKTSRSKSVLYQAQRQVLNLEKRWASSPRDTFDGPQPSQRQPSRLRSASGASKSVPQLVHFS